MPVLTIRNFDEDAKARLQDRARANGRSMESEARQTLYASLEISPKKRDLSKIKHIDLKEPDGFDWFAVDEEELRLWEGE